ncbi:hypothetical protein DO97_13755 [Neosynechococcus sphagnicola sy1]|uniref:Histidine kinase n=1 Tax=Neosynechococcus sphagnicola sy1 TaxID=1497020 RepID=A0A098TIP0_9CYAN|nr:response regulator [Neosynechococcus sphagnicola]KGF71969.1 hypothetical protein DO97_13755 [Neosynechococcus sphagnicola sy1]
MAAPAPELLVAGAVLPPLRILLAEDNLINQKVALQILQRLGYRADVAANGLEVLAALRRQSYDVVFMDVQMPEMDGLTTTRHLCQEWDGAVRPRIIAMTANAMPETRQACLEAGMDGYISKPVRQEELLQALRLCQPPIMTGTDPLPSPLMLDVNALGELQTLIGDDLATLIDIYLENAARLLQEIATAVAESDPTSFQFAVHNLKSTSATVGAQRLAQDCQTLETHCQTKPLSEVLPDLQPLQAEFLRVKAVLQQFMSPRET